MPGTKKKGSTTRNISTAKKKRKTSSKVETIKIQSASRKFNVANQLLTFTNPTYDDQDLEYFEEIWANTSDGTAIDKKAEFVIGGGIKPTLEIVNDDGLTDEQKQKVLAEYDELLNQLMYIDRDVKLNQNVFDAYVMAKVFGRATTLFDHDQTFEGSAKGVPRSLKLLHSRDLSKPEINEDDRSLNFLE